MNQINIDFEIYDSRNPKTFIILDTSEWSNLENKPSIIEIILPGEKKPITHYFSKKSVNIFNAGNLNLSCETCTDGHFDIELPDGIYSVTVKGSPDNFNKNKKYLRVTKTQLKLDNLFINLASECYNTDSDFKSKIDNLNEIQFLIRSAEANVRYDNMNAAQILLFKAQKLIDKVKPCKNCV